MKRKIFVVVLFLAVAVVITGIVFTTSAPAMDIGESTWDTNYNIMYLSQEGTSVTGEYIYDDGYLTATLEGQLLKGWWRESGNVKECGPGNAWSGPLVFLFADDWMSFQGDWGDCKQGIDDLDPSDNTWYGTRTDNDYFTEEECVAAGRHWCDGICQIVECGTEITPEECENAGKIWCNGVCQIEECGTTTIPDTSTTTVPVTSTTTTPASTTTSTITASTTTTSCNVPCVTVCCEPGYACSFFIGCIPKSCIYEFIYGEDSEEVELLRNFRDEVLSQSPVGQEIIELYYQWSPVIAKAMEEDESFKEEVKEMIDGVLVLIGESGE